MYTVIWKSSFWTNADPDEWGKQLDFGFKLSNNSPLDIWLRNFGISSFMKKHIRGPIIQSLNI